MAWQTPEALQTALTTELNALPNATSDTTGYSVVSPEVDNETDKYQFIGLELNLALQGSARSTGATVEIWISVAVDSTPNYPNGSNAALIAGLLTSFQLDAAATARRLTKENIPIPPFKFELQVRNITGQALAASANTLKYRRYNEV